MEDTGWLVPPHTDTAVTDPAVLRAALGMAARTIELAEMARDLFDDRRGFAAKQRDFLRKAAPQATPERLRFADVRETVAR